jgi:Na+/citrate or Na+/malate symporter
VSTSSWTLVVGGGAGLVLTVFGAVMLFTGRAPDGTARAFRSIRDAGCYHLLFGLGLTLVVLATVLRSSAAAVVSTVVAIVLVAVAVIRFRPRGRRSLSGK